MNISYRQEVTRTQGELSKPDFAAADLRYPTTHTAAEPKQQKWFQIPWLLTATVSLQQQTNHTLLLTKPAIITVFMSNDCMNCLHFRWNNSLWFILCNIVIKVNNINDIYKGNMTETIRDKSFTNINCVDVHLLGIWSFKCFIKQK